MYVRFVFGGTLISGALQALARHVRFVVMVMSIF